MPDMLVDIDLSQIWPSVGMSPDMLTNFRDLNAEIELPPSVSCLCNTFLDQVFGPMYQKL